jgi:N-acetyl-gamma-glutamyl-phosphate reductase
MLKVGIIGGGGYTAGELIRILQYHPGVEISFVQSASQAGKFVHETHDDLIGDCELSFTAEISTEVDALFLCMGHGQSPTFMAQHDIPDHVAVIDLGNDFRLDESWVYGLPELNRAAIQQSKRIANPGCFATTIQLGLLPLAKAGLLGKEVHINAITGSTGAGQAPSPTTHFSWRASNLSVYKAFNHQHLGEIRRSLVQAQANFVGDLNFIPLRGDFTRGILATIYLDCDWSEADLQTLFAQTYAQEPFTIVSAANPHLKQVVNTNKCLVHIEKHGNKAFIISAIDNLTKGASGQAVQNLNLVFGLPEQMGLNLKAVAF